MLLKSARVTEYQHALIKLAGKIEQEDCGCHILVSLQWRWNHSRKALPPASPRHSAKPINLKSDWYCLKHAHIHTHMHDSLIYTTPWCAHSSTSCKVLRTLHKHNEECHFSVLSQHRADWLTTLGPTEEKKIKKAPACALDWSTRNIKTSTTLNSQRSSTTLKEL